jgi:hypothetical protein
MELHSSLNKNRFFRATWFIEEDERDSKGKLVFTPLEEDVCQQLSEAYLTEKWNKEIVIGDQRFIISRPGVGRMYRHVNTTTTTNRNAH